MVFWSDTYSEMSDLDETLPRRSPDINEGFSGDYAILNLDLGVELNKKHMWSRRTILHNMCVYVKLNSIEFWY